VAGEFAAFDEYVLIPPEFIDDAFDTELVPDGSHPKLRLSIDVSDGGADSSVITAAYHYDSFIYVVKQLPYYFDPSIAIIELAKAAISMFEGLKGNKDIDDFVVDAIGVGAGVAGYLMDKGFNVVRNVGGEASDEPDRWRNRRTQNYLALHEAYSQGTIQFAPDAVDDEEELRAHLLSIKRNPGSEKVDDIEPKDKIKKQGLPSPDRADSLSMQYNSMAPTMGLADVGPTLIGTMESQNYDASLA
jgi:hypothetical protein